MKTYNVLTTLVFTILAFSLRQILAGSSDVLDLTKANFDETIKNKALIMVEFFAPWCGHCKALAPEYEKAATELKEIDVTLAKVDCTAETDICNSQDVKGFPTLKIFRNGTPSEYQKARKADEIVAYMTKQTLPALSDVSADNFDEFKEKDKVVVVGFFSEKAGPEFEAFKSLAEKQRDTYIFGASIDASIAEKEEVKVPGVVMYKKFDEGKNIFPQNVEGDEPKLELKDLENFVLVNSVPLIDDIGPENYMKYHDSGLPLGFVFVASDEHRKTLGKVFEPLAKQHRGKLNFVYIDANQFGGHAANLNLKENWPAFGIQYPEKNLKYPFDQSKEITSEAVSAFVDEFLGGKISPSIKSQPIPEKNDEPVKVVVADSFNDIVADKEKDVLIEFYAPWCGHCQRLAPIYEGLAKKLSSVESLVIAKMDATENDIPQDQDFVVEGFPTIKFFKAKTNEIVDYSGDRTEEGFISFLKENAAIPFEVPESAEDETDKGSSETEQDTPADAEKETESEETSSDEKEHDEL